jgi:hypothetical protein
MRDASVKLLRELGKPATAKELARLIADRKVSNAKISVADVRQLVETLVLDGILDYAGAGERRLRMLPRATRHLFPFGLVFDAVEEEGGGRRGVGGGGRDEEDEEGSDDDGMGVEEGGPPPIGGPSSGPVVPASGFNLIPAGPGLASGKFSISAGGGSSATVGLGGGMGARMAATARSSFAREPVGGGGGGRDDGSEIAGGAGEEDSGRGGDDDEDDEDDDSDEEEDESEEEEAGGLRRAGQGKPAIGPRRYMLSSKQLPDGGLLEALSSSPCGVCPVARQCSPAGVISPRTCTYYTHWLSDVAW